jgi:hypothetical protein
MTIIEVLTESKASGGKKAFMRPNCSGGFVRWVDGFTYEFTADDLMADDWEDVGSGIPKLTGGRWGAVSEDK